jgi:hypothetical protein
MDRNFIATLSSSILLLFAILFWQELFIFQKTTINYPAWAKSLPYPFMGAHIIVLLTLIPIATLSKADIAFIKNISIASIAIPTLPIFTLIYLNNNSLTFNNIASDLMWAIGIICIPAALLVIIGRVIFDIYKERGLTSKSSSRV